MPRSQLTSALLRINADTFDLEVVGMYNPWIDDKFVNQWARLKRGYGSSYVLRTKLSDGAGSYAVEWLIGGRSTTRTILSTDEWIVLEYFTK